MSDMGLTLEEDLARVQQKYARFIVGKNKPEPGEIEFVNVKDFWQQHYTEYALSAVSSALRKADAALQYIAGIQKHPSYSEEEYTQLGNPVGEAAILTVQQAEWVNQQLNSSTFFTMRADQDKEERAFELSAKLDDIKERSITVLSRHFKEAVKQMIGLDAQFDAQATNRNVVFLGNAEPNALLNDIVDEYYSHSRDQLENRLAITDRIIDLHVEGTVIRSPFLNRHADLSEAYLEASMTKINTQMKEIEWVEKSRTVYMEKGKIMFPLLKPQALDFSL